MNTTMMLEQSKQYWSDELQLPLPGFHLYTDGTLNFVSKEAAQTDTVLDLEAVMMKRYSELYDMKAWMLAGYAVFLHRMTQDNDILIGVQNRRGDVLPLRISISGTDSYRHVYEQILAKLDRIEETELTLADMEGITGQALEFQTIYGVKPQYKASRLNWYVQKEPGSWLLHVSYDPQLFEEATIQKYILHFQRLLSGVLEDGDMDTSIGSLPILTEADLKAYAILNNTKMELPERATLVEMLSSVVHRVPDRVALSANQDQLTYRQLDLLSNKIANMLMEKGLQKGEFVSLFMERSMETIVSLFGVMKAGGAYIPLDPTHPEERNAYIIEDTKSKVILTESSFIPKLVSLLAGFEQKPEIVCLDQLEKSYSEEACGVSIEEDDLAYVIYTSGSTGKPKGALIAHKGVMNLALSTQKDLTLTEDDVILQYSTFSFDASVYDIFSSIGSGARLHLLSDEERFSIDAFTEAVDQTQATRVAILPTVFFNRLAAYLPENAADLFRNIKSIAVGGEALTGETVRMFQKKLQIPIINLYGPTEITAVATGHTVDYQVPEEISTVVIGTPLANYELYIVDGNNDLCPIGVTGELLISSVGVAKGYLNQPEKTKEAFISDPINPNSGKEFYRSGDLVRLLPNGQVEYRGRRDSQIKIRGFRIEIGEIEDNFAKHDEIKDVAVIPQNEDGTKVLVGFYTTNNSEPISKKDLVQFLGQKVPSYMVPKYICHVEEMPLSPTGKIDRKKLATYEVAAEEDASVYEAPETDIQREVAEAWEKVLGQSKISIHDDFFEIGGYSLKILEILVLLKPSYPSLKINDFFLYPTIAKLAERIENFEHAPEKEEVDAATLPIQDLAEYPAVFASAHNFKNKTFTQENVLLTGATGYLGSHLLAELLQRSNAAVYCLVRSSSGQDPYSRLVQTMISYFGAEAEKWMENRVFALEGELEKENLGLSDTNQAIVNEHIDSIIHCGADVRHFGESEHFSRVNVESTNRLLSLARSNAKIRFHFISTLGIPEELAENGQWAHIVEGTGYETAFVENVYTNSKLEAEKLVIKAGEEGLPVNVYRVGNLSARSDNGIFQKNIDNNAFYRMLKAMLLLKKAPRVRWEVDITPIDYAGQAITALALQDETVGRVFHICNPVTISYEQMVEYFKAAGYDITLMELKEFEAWLLNPSESKDQAGVELAMAQLEGDGAKNSMFRYTCPQTVEYLADSGVQCAEPDKQFFSKLISHAVDVEYFIKP
ncbi:amino acid adenylation domain-containing protein [Neobacillus mesonae]|nr:amino acid adenylation domain-containing protein [Neobacillus mesonae]